MEEADSRGNKGDTEGLGQLRAPQVGLCLRVDLGRDSRSYNVKALKPTARKKAIRDVGRTNLSAIS